MRFYSRSYAAPLAVILAVLLAPRVHAQMPSTPPSNCPDRCIADAGTGWFQNLPTNQQPVSLQPGVAQTFDTMSHEVSVTVLLDVEESGECRIDGIDCKHEEGCKFVVQITLDDGGTIETSALGLTEKQLDFPGSDWDGTTTRIDANPPSGEPNAFLEDRDGVTCGTVDVFTVKVWFDPNRATIPLPGGQGHVGVPFPGNPGTPSPPDNLWRSPFMNLACAGCDSDWWNTVAQFE